MKGVQLEFIIYVQLSLRKANEFLKGFIAEINKISIFDAMTTCSLLKVLWSSSVSEKTSFSLKG